jgi:hypothetical protein
MITVAQRVAVAFAGDGAGTGELSWGQRDIWQAMVRQKSWLPNGAWGPLPAGTTVDDVADMLRYIMSRFPTARTRLVFDAAGQPTQAVAGGGETVLEIVDAGDADAGQVADEVRLHYQDAAYDFAADWPLRMAAIRRDGVLTHLVVVMCHLVTDAGGAQILLEELDRRVDTPLPEAQSLEQARWQASPAGLKQNATARRHWENILRAMPLRRFPASIDRHEPRHWRGEYTSQALGPALETITARTGVGSAAALLGVFAVSLARVGGVNPVAIRPMVNNRFRPGLDRVVCMLAQYGLCLLDVADLTLQEALARSQRASLSTHKNAYYDPAQMDALVDRVVAERGTDLELPCYFNDRRGPAAGGGADWTAQRLREAAGLAEFVWTTRQDIPFEPLIVHIDDLPAATRVTVFMDTHVISPADAEALLRGMEAVAVEAALDPTATTRIPAGASSS